MVTSGKDDLWMCDLFDMVKYESWNNGIKYILLVIDVFSKYVWLRPLKNKTGASVAEAFKDIFQSSKRNPSRLVSDKGQEFRAHVVQRLMKQYGILYFPTQNETKASVSERAIKTIKTKISRYFTYTDDYSYLPILQDITDSYNGTYHRTIGTTPSDVTENNEEAVHLSTYLSRRNDVNTTLRRFKYKVGDYVRISHLKTPFTRAYDETFTGEMFKIDKRYRRGDIPVYRLRDMQDDEIKGTFYQSELQKVDIDPDMLWKVEKILKTRGKGKNKQSLVKWKYYPQKFNDWLYTRDIN